MCFLFLDKISNSIQSESSTESVVFEKEFSFGEEMINQGIETIEFVLGKIFTWNKIIN